MTMERIESPPTVIAVRAEGTLRKEDYTDVLLPAIEELMKTTDELRAVIVVGDLSGITPGGFWEDAKTGFSHLTKWKRCAVATDKEWVRHGVSLFGWMMPGEIKMFDENDVEAAIEWAAA